MDTVEIKALVPARDFELSKRFHADVGFDIAWSSEDLAYLRAGNSSFLLQRLYQKEHAENFMTHHARARRRGVVAACRVPAHCRALRGTGDAARGSPLGHS